MLRVFKTTNLVIGTLKNYLVILFTVLAVVIAGCGEDTSPSLSDESSGAGVDLSDAYEVKPVILDAEEPYFSPGGTQIMFRKGSIDYYLIRIDGSREGEVPLGGLIFSREYDGWRSDISADGSWCISEVGADRLMMEYRTYNSSWMDRTYMTSLAFNHYGRSPAISRDGERVAYVMEGTDGKERIWIKDVDSGGESLIFECDVRRIYTPSFSRNGMQLVFSATANAANENADLFLLSLEGLASVEDIRLKGIESVESRAEVVEVKELAEGFAITIKLFLGGPNLERLTFNEAHDSHPVLSPDGTKVAFTSTRRGKTVGVYLMDLTKPTGK